MMSDADDIADKVGKVIVQVLGESIHAMGKDAAISNDQMLEIINRIVNDLTEDYCRKLLAQTLFKIIFASEHKITH